MSNPLLVSEFASQPVVTVSIEDTLEHAYRVLVERMISSVLVVGKDGSALGVLSRRNLLEVGRVTARIRNRPSSLELPNLRCGEVMSRPVAHVGPDATVTEAARVMLEHKVHRVFVLDRDGAPRGVFSTRDVMTVVRTMRLATPLAEIASAQVVTISTHATLAEGLLALASAGVGGVFVLDEALPIGVFGEAEAISARELPPTTPIEEVMEPSLVLLPARTPLYRAASFSMSTSARRIGVVNDHHHVHGIVTGMDFCRALVETAPAPVTGVAAG